MSRILVRNTSSLSDTHAMSLVVNVMVDGRVSGDCYCFVTLFPKHGIAISASRTRAGSDSFYVWDHK
jgi:hypothetical protein